MQTARKTNRRKIIAVAVILAVLVGGVASYFLFLRKTGGGSTPDFTISVKIGDPSSNANTWAPLTSYTTLLNGTSISLVVVATGSGGFNDFVQVKLPNFVSGVTAKLVRATLHPLSGGMSFTGLTLTAGPDIPTRELPYNFTITGTSSSTTHGATFPLRIRATTISVSPSSVQVLAGARSTFTVRVGVSDVYDLLGFQFALLFDPSIIQAVNATFAPVFIPPNGYIAAPQIDNSTGQIYLAALILGSECQVNAPCINSPAPQVYNIANVTFTNSSSIGQTSLRFSPHSSTNVILTELLPGSYTNSVSEVNVIDGSVSVIKRSTTTSVACSPSTVALNQGTMCTATVTDTSPGTFITPTGIVHFASSVDTSTFTSSASCALSGSAASAACSVTYTQTSVTTPPVITSSYDGDATHLTSTGTTTVTVT